MTRNENQLFVHHFEIVIFNALAEGYLMQLSVKAKWSIKAFTKVK